MPNWLTQVGSDIITFFVGGGLVLAVVNFWLNHKLKSVVTRQQERYEEKVTEIKLVKEYRRTISRQFFWIHEKLTCKEGNGSLAAIDRQYDKTQQEFDEADTRMKEHDDILVAKYKSKRE